MKAGQEAAMTNQTHITEGDFYFICSAGELVFHSLIQNGDIRKDLIYFKFSFAFSNIFLSHKDSQQTEELFTFSISLLKKKTHKNSASKVNSHGIGKEATF